MKALAENSVHKHSISQIQASPLGVVATMLGDICLLAFLEITGLKGFGDGHLDIDWFV